MADTQRTVSAILALLADNTSRAISPQDLRDAFVSWRMASGQIYIPDGSGAATTISGTANYYEVTDGTWSLSGDAYLFDESGGNGRLTYIGTEPIMAHIACTLSSVCAASTQVLHFRLGITGTTNANAEVQMKIGTGSDVISTALHLIAELDTNDYISLWVRNATSAANVTVNVANLQAVTMPM